MKQLLDRLHTGWVKLDSAFLNALDAFVLWAWNELELSRNTILRMAIFITIVLNYLAHLYGSNPASPFSAILMSGFMLGWQIIEELANRWMTADNRNFGLMHARHNGFLLGVRWGMVYAWVFIDVVRVFFNHRVGLDLAAEIGVALYISLTYTMIPTEPPQKKRKLVLVPARASS